jgi:hypothetical protein
MKWRTPRLAFRIDAEQLGQRQQMVDLGEGASGEVMNVRIAARRREGSSRPRRDRLFKRAGVGIPQIFEKMLEVDASSPTGASYRGSPIAGAARPMVGCGFVRGTTSARQYLREITRERLRRADRTPRRLAPRSSHA